MKQVLIIGGGAAGLMAAVSAAQHGAKVTILEKMKGIGRKILITGKGRCNLTNSCDISELVKNMPGNGSFLYSAFHAFSNLDSIEFFNQAGLPTKVERGGRVFPVSDQAKDVIKAFARQLAKLDVAVKLGQPVKKLIVENGRAVGAATMDAEYRADAIIVTTGGASYPGTGSSGDGYRLAEAIGHTIIPLKPSLVPLEVEEEWITELQGLSLKNVTATIICDGKKVADEFGELLFTHYGLSGPIILSLSKKVAELFVTTPGKEVTIEINLKPALSMEILDKRLQRDFTKFAKKQLKNSLHELLPSKLIPVVIDLSFIDADKFVHQITKEERSRLLNVLQHLTFTISQTRPVTDAIVTAGGVSTKEIDARTMESKVVNALFFAGEVIDIDGYTGGFNLQAAFSTGYVAGKYAAT
ncbi:tricarballylate dehydrogenase [Sporomusa ovata DSM 2662]|uniref:NAD(FAD)-utilizing dehydrogenases n=1 Tax=Sporomusa ovata TaxID=2378 RepID=A0A0U1L3Q6_9FIRM|nr:aminoacetone oxidase family FAD-binding enzyme [Sporomusa ovata]EQB25769.1 flavoprotein [Sporomusa ovata DSM 2662]CQR74331.1 NAD(FAD)-utilizing dehydrogenases [Sporomusa ovata]